MGLVLFWVRLGQTHMLACATWLDVGADTVKHRLLTQLGIGADIWGWSYFWLG